MASFKVNLSNLKVRAKGLAPACHLKFLIRYQITPDLISDQIGGDLISDQIYLIISNYCHIECLQLLYTFGRSSLVATCWRQALQTIYIHSTSTHHDCTPWPIPIVPAHQQKKVLKKAT